MTAWFSTTIRAMNQSLIMNSYEVRNSPARDSLFQKSKDGKRHRTKQRRQLVPNVPTRCPYHSSNGPCIPCDFHAQRGTHKPECKSRRRSPSERQCFRASPRIPIVIVPTRTAEDDVFFDDDNKVNDGPVPDDRQECLQHVFKERCCAAPDHNGCDEPERNEHVSGDSKGPRPKVLGMQSERIVVWNVVLLS